MTDEKYRPSKLDDALTRIAEECSEVIKIVCKAQRFGLNDTHPQKGKKNIDLLAEELADVETARQDFLHILAASQPTPSDADLQAMMRDPRYWRDQDPTFVSKVTEGFQKLYGRK